MDSIKTVELVYFTFGSIVFFWDLMTWRKQLIDKRPLYYSFVIGFIASWFLTYFSLYRGEVLQSVIYLSLLIVFINRIIGLTLHRRRDYSLIVFISSMYLIFLPFSLSSIHSVAYTVSNMKLISVVLAIVCACLSLLVIFMKSKNA